MIYSTIEPCWGLDGVKEAKLVEGKMLRQRK